MLRKQGGHHGVNYKRMTPTRRAVVCSICTTPLPVEYQVLPRAGSAWIWVVYGAPETFSGWMAEGVISLQIHWRDRLSACGSPNLAPRLSGPSLRRLAMKRILLALLPCHVPSRHGGGPPGDLTLMSSNRRQRARFYQF